MVPCLRMLLWILILVPYDVTAGAGVESTPQPQPAERGFTFEPGSPEACPQTELPRLQALPGYGWDSLQNREMATVFRPTYRKCRVTGDRKFLIPDGVQARAQKRSDVQIYSTLIEKVSDFKSATSNSVDVNVGFSFIVSVHASFSAEFRSTKERMVKGRASTARTQCRYVFYTLRTEPDSPLSPDFRRRLYDMAAAAQADRPRVVRHLAGLLVKDYGTHVITRTDVGATLVREDQVRTRYVRDHAGSESKITAAASASFLVSISVKYSHTASKDQVQSYLGNRTSSRVYSFGGPPIGADLKLSAWTARMEENLVAVDRAGDPLWLVVSPAYLPELPGDTVSEVAAAVREAVRAYYEHNTYPGCTDVDSPNYSYQANVDDKSCGGPRTNYSFGGVYQTCDGKVCNESFTQKNPLTGGFSCPLGYVGATMGTFRLRTDYCVRKCKHFGAIKFKCHDECKPEYFHVTPYTAYWCADTRGRARANSGYMFGGLYTDGTTNPGTGSRSCPAGFSALGLGTQRRMYVCVSDEYETAHKFSQPFAGFFTCRAGNPLTLSSPAVKIQAGDRSNQSGGTSKLSSYLYKAGSQSWPGRCPQGYSQQLFTIPEDTCAVHYCVRPSALPASGLPLLRTPPFSPTPPMSPNDTRLLATASDTILTRSGNAGAAGEWKQVSAEKEAGDKPEVKSRDVDSRGKWYKQLVAVGTMLGVVITVLVLTLGVIGALGLRRRRRARAVPWGKRGRSVTEETKLCNMTVT